MIESLDGFPQGIVAFKARGRITRHDYDKVLVPKVEEAFRRHPRLRCYYELGPEYAGMEAGAMWEDFKVGIAHLAGWERVAVVTDVEWIRIAVNAFRFLIPGEIRVFETRESGIARAWIADGPAR
jgi:hypothetical protein